MTLKIDIQNLNFWYGERQVLHHVSMQVPSHTVTALIGPSGCGKSTLLRCLNRMHEIVKDTRLTGQITLDGDDLLAINAVNLRRRVGMIFQKPNPFPTMSIFDNVAAGLVLNGVRDRHVVRERVVDSLQKSALWDEVKDKLHHSGTSLSGGQQQRLCIARALAINPEVILMDEPCSALDPISTARIEELIHELRKLYTILIVTHNMQQAARVSDTTAFLYMGELVEFGNTNVIFTTPKERQTEDYITGRFG